MIKHLIKLIWNKRRSNFLLTTEIFASFIVLFGVMSLIFYNYRNFAQPLGYDYQNVWAIYFTNQGMPDSLFREHLDRAGDLIRRRPQVASVATSSFNTPFSFSSMRWGIQFEGKDVNAEMVLVDEHSPAVLSLQLEEGRWINEADVTTKQRVVVLNRQTKEALFGEEQAVGKLINMDRDETWKVVGVLGNYKKDGEFQEPTPAVFLNNSADGQGGSVFLVKVKSSADAQFEADLLKDLNRLFKSENANIELSYLQDQRRAKINLVRVPMLIAGVVCGFLLLNVGLGLFGVLWLNIRKRRDEIGLRRALGASSSGIVKHFIGEALVIAAFGTLVGLFFAVQFPLLDVFNLNRAVYVQSMGASLAILTLLVTLCALYPSRQAATVRPAEALHDQ